MAPRNDNGDGGEDKGYRLSITIDPSIRKNLRLAAALHDMNIGEWSAAVLEKAAEKAVEKMPKVSEIV